MTKTAMRRSGYLTSPKTPQTPTIGTPVKTNPAVEDMMRGRITRRGSKVPKVQWKRIPLWALRAARRNIALQTVESIITTFDTTVEVPPTPSGAWVKVRDCDTQYPVNWSFRSSGGSNPFTSSVTRCLTGQAGGTPLEVPISTGTHVLNLGYQYETGTGLLRWRSVTTWARPLGSPPGEIVTTQTQTQYVLGHAVGIVEETDLFLDYWMQPYRVNSPWPQGSTRTNAPTLPARVPSTTAPPTRPDIVVVVPPRTATSPSLATGTAPGSKPSNPMPSPNPPTTIPPFTRPPSHQQTKPGKNTKETGKGRLSPVASALWAGANNIGEIGDVIDIAYTALPKEIQQKAWGQYAPKGQVGVPPIVPPWAKAITIYQNQDKVNVPKVIYNILMNEIEDKLIAIPGKYLKDHTYGKPWYGRPVGLETGPAL